MEVTTSSQRTVSRRRNSRILKGSPGTLKNCLSSVQTFLRQQSSSISLFLNFPPFFTYIGGALSEVDFRIFEQSMKRWWCFFAPPMCDTAGRCVFTQQDTFTLQASFFFSPLAFFLSFFYILCECVRLRGWFALSTSPYFSSLFALWYMVNPLGESLLNWGSLFGRIRKSRGKKNPKISHSHHFMGSFFFVSFFYHHIIRPEFFLNFDGV